jgi:serine/threonine-protein kinase RsbW
MLLFRKCGCVPGGESGVEIALREALANAIIHGNHENPRKHVYVRFRCEPDEVSFAVKDEGRGFDLKKLADPTAPENIEAVHGRGIYLMKALMDEVRSKKVALSFICERAPAKVRPKMPRRARRGRPASDCDSNRY